MEALKACANSEVNGYPNINVSLTLGFVKYTFGEMLHILMLISNTAMWNKRLIKMIILIGRQKGR